jgi:hypothetical protein
MLAARPAGRAANRNLDQMFHGFAGPAQISRGAEFCIGSRWAVRYITSVLCQTGRTCEDFFSVEASFRST